MKRPSHLHLRSAIRPGTRVRLDGTEAVLLTACVVPPGMVFVLWRRAPTETIGEILYAENTGTSAGGSHD
jgi:hypothetical protein